MLDWLVRHEPGYARTVIAQVIGEARERFGVPRHVTVNTIATALTLDGKLDNEALDDYLERSKWGPRGVCSRERSAAERSVCTVGRACGTLLTCGNAPDGDRGSGGRRFKSCQLDTSS